MSCRLMFCEPCLAAVSTSHAGSYSETRMICDVVLTDVSVSKVEPGSAYDVIILISEDLVQQSFYGIDTKNKTIIEKFFRINKKKADTRHRQSGGWRDYFLLELV